MKILNFCTIVACGALAVRAGDAGTETGPRGNSRDLTEIPAPIPIPSMFGGVDDQSHGERAARLAAAAQRGGGGSAAASSASGRGSSSESSASGSGSSSESSARGSVVVGILFVVGTIGK
eukprot:TRINITY_DN3137_c0_g1_i1.p2 TRINITY_DN3137_c0_g1~~TRINITY_DN3137_c0_g1_i1.p2  ORF type:complete len:120 (-),score=32.65 TRINITY_DN3137_c0_g1_i1:613-972(-)